MNLTHLDVAFSWAADKAALGGIHGQCFDSRVMGLEALPLDLKREVQHADPAFSPSTEQQLLFWSKSQHSGTRLMAAKACNERNIYRVLWYTQTPFLKHFKAFFKQNHPCLVITILLGRRVCGGGDFARSATRAIVSLVTFVWGGCLGHTEHSSSPQRCPVGLKWLKPPLYSVFIVMLEQVWAA